MVVLEGDGFRLRPFREEDLQDLVEGLDNPNVTRYTLRLSYPYTEEMGKAWIKDSQERTLRLVIDVDGKLIGSVALDEIKEGKAKLGYWLAEPHWGKGIMTRAVALLLSYAKETPGIGRIIASVYVKNIGSQRVLEKNSFVKTGKKSEMKGDVKKEAYCYEKVLA